MLPGLESTVKDMIKQRLKTDPFGDLSWDDLEDWAGRTIAGRGKSYQRDGNVQDLARTPGGGLIAWVEGSERYATRVELKTGELSSDCTCPYGDVCKHAVAVALEYLDHVKRNTPVPEITDGDKRLRLLEAMTEEDEEDDWDEQECEKIEADSESVTNKRGWRPDTFLEKQTKAQLVALLKDLADSYPAVRNTLQDRDNLSQGSVEKMVQAVRKEIDAVSAKPGWTNHWNNDGFIPDYSGVRKRLEILLAASHADEVLALGEELLDAGKEQVEMSDDEGETAEEIASCLDVVFQALPQSSLAPSEQMLWAVKAELADGYDLCSGAESFWEHTYPESDWNTLADKLWNLLHNLPSAKPKDTSSTDYHRDRLSDWAIQALEKAGRSEEVIPLCEREAPKTQSYVRLVNMLKGAKRYEEAEKWIHKGIAATQKAWPGIAGSLRDTLRKMREENGDWLSASAFRADDFVRGPSLSTYQELKKAAKKADVWPAVREAAMAYLENGRLPGTESAWPLPKTGVSETIDRRTGPFPITEVLLDIAIAENSPDEIIRWHEQRKNSRPRWGWDDSRDDSAAAALVAHYPERAVTIWKQLAESQIALTKPRAYEVAAGYLRKVRRVFKDAGKEPEWQNYAAELRRVNARKIRFIEILNSACR